MLDVKGIKPGYIFSFATSQTFEIWFVFSCDLIQRIEARNHKETTIIIIKPLRSPPSYPLP
jgi:hypothetical protein